MKVASITPCLNETDYLGAVLEALRSAGIYRNLVVINKFGFRGDGRDKGKTEEVAKKLGAEVLVGDYGSEANTRNTFLQILQNEGYDYVAIVDADEIHVPVELKSLIEDLDKDPTQRYPAFRVGAMRTFWRYPNVVIEPPEPFHPIFLVRSDIRFMAVRDLGPGVGIVDLPNYPMFHFSYARPEQKILEKITNFEHADEVIDGWYENVFLKWQPSMTNLHPTHPQSYAHAKVIKLPEALTELLERHGSKWVKENMHFDGKTN